MEPIVDRTDIQVGGQHVNTGLLKAEVENAVDGILTIDESGTVITANAAVERIFGYRASDPIGQYVRMRLPTPCTKEHDSDSKSDLKTLRDILIQESKADAI